MDKTILVMVTKFKVVSIELKGPTIITAAVGVV